MLHFIFKTQMVKVKHLLQLASECLLFLLPYEKRRWSLSFSLRSCAPTWAKRVKNPPAMPETQVPLEKGMATHSSILAWRIPWTEEPGRLHGVAKSWTQLKSLSVHAWGWSKLMDLLNTVTCKSGPLVGLRGCEPLQSWLLVNFSASRDLRREMRG